MYVNPFFAGVVCALVGELVLLIVLGAWSNWKERNKAKWKK